MLPFISLDTLIVDPQDSSAGPLITALSKYRRSGNHRFVGNLIRVTDLAAAKEALEHDHFNCIFIDPLLLGLDAAADFIFTIRRICPSIVFVLFSNSDHVLRSKTKFYAGERKRFLHYFKLNKKSKGAKLKDKLLHLVHLCMSDIRLQTSLAHRKVFDDRMKGTPAPPIEISESLGRFKLRYHQKQTAFIVMSFEKTKTHIAIAKAIKESLKRFNIIAMRADDFEFNENLYDNILTYMFGCDFGIAVVERISKDFFNANIAFEIGYMKGLKKPVCILKEKTITTMQADLLGKLYREFDAQAASASIDHALNKWVGEMLAKT